MFEQNSAVLEHSVVFANELKFTVGPDKIDFSIGPDMEVWPLCVSDEQTLCNESTSESCPLDRTSMFYKERLCRKLENIYWHAKFCYYRFCYHQDYIKIILYFHILNKHYNKYRCSILNWGNVAINEKMVYLDRIDKMCNPKAIKTQ